MNRNSCSASNELRLASCAWSRRYRMTSSLPRNRGGKHLHLSYSLPIATQASSQYLFRHFPPVGSSGTSLGALVASLPQFILPILRFAPVFFTAPFFIFSLCFFFFGCLSRNLHGAGGVSSCFHALHFPHSLFFSPPFSFPCVPSGERGAYCWMTAYGCRFDDLTL